MKEHQLCPKLCSFEQSKEECFSYQLKRCHGACVHEEKSADYNVRVLQAVDTLKEMVWPFQGAIAIKEECAINKITQLMKFNQWRYLGSVVHVDELKTLHDIKKHHDLDAYRILVSYMKHQLKPEQMLLCD